MSAYLPTVPTGTIPLDEDYRNLQANFQQLDTSFGVDHYAFSSQTNNGLHNKVTTPVIVGAAHPLTTTNVPQFYAMEQTANLGVLQFSKGPPVGALQVASTPVTSYQSILTGVTLNTASDLNILDFNGFGKAYGRFMLLSTSTFTTNTTIDCSVFFNGATFEFKNPGSANFRVNNAGTVLVVRSTFGVAVNDIFWTLQLMRVN